VSTKLYAGGFPYSTTDAQLGELFSPYGSVVSARESSRIGSPASREASGSLKWEQVRQPRRR
jgi:RNA recognition motif-containing protein